MAPHRSFGRGDLQHPQGRARRGPEEAPGDPQPRPGHRALDADLVFLQEVRSFPPPRGAPLERTWFGWPDEPRPISSRPRATRWPTAPTPCHARRRARQRAAVALAAGRHRPPRRSTIASSSAACCTCRWLRGQRCTHRRAPPADARRARAPGRAHIGLHQPMCRMASVCIVAGDFNDWGEARRRCASLASRASQAGARLPMTFPSRVPVFSLDRIYVRLRCVPAPCRAAGLGAHVRPPAAVAEFVAAWAARRCAEHELTLLAGGRRCSRRWWLPSPRAQRGDARDPHLRLRPFRAQRGRGARARRRRAASRCAWWSTAWAPARSARLARALGGGRRAPAHLQPGARLAPAGAARLAAPAPQAVRGRWRHRLLRRHQPAGRPPRPQPRRARTSAPGFRGARAARWRKTCTTPTRLWWRLQTAREAAPGRCRGRVDGGAAAAAGVEEPVHSAAWATARAPRWCWRQPPLPPPHRQHRLAIAQARATRSSSPTPTSLPGVTLQRAPIPRERRGGRSRRCCRGATSISCSTTPAVPPWADAGPRASRSSSTRRASRTPRWR